MSRAILLLCLLVFSELSHGVCDKHLLVNAINNLDHTVSPESIGYPSTESGNITENNIFYACKPLPNNKRFSAIAIASFNEKLTKADPHYSEDNGALYDLIVMVADTKTGKISAKHTSKGVLGSDAIRLERLIVDTGRYYLDSDSTTFGIRVRNSSHSMIYLFQEEKLFLYRFNKNQLQLVIQDLEMQNTNGNKNDCCDAEDIVDVEYDSSKTIITVAPTITSGLHDIVLTKKTNKEIYHAASTDITYTKPKIRRTLVKFNGKDYSIPKAK